MPDIQLSLKDRMMLRNQYMILSILDKSGDVDYERAMKIVEQGFESEYGSLTGPIDPDPVSRDTCSKVMDILEMFHALQCSYDALEDKAGIDVDELRFFGFDGNNEPDMLAFGKFLNQEGRFPESQVRNSHMPSAAIYERMLTEIAKYRNMYALSNAEIRAVLDARIHPTMR